MYYKVKNKQHTCTVNCTFFNQTTPAAMTFVGIEKREE